MLMAMNDVPGIRCSAWQSIKPLNQFGRTAYYRRTCTDACGRQKTEYGDRYQNRLPSSVTESSFGAACAAAAAPVLSPRPTIASSAGVAPQDVRVAGPSDAPPEWASKCTPWAYRGMTATRTCKPIKPTGRMSRGRSAEFRPRKQTFDMRTGQLSGMDDADVFLGVSLPVSLPVAGAVLGYMANRKLSGVAFGLAIAYGIKGLTGK